MYKTTERCDTQEKLVAALETIGSVEILNKDQFLHGEEFCRNLKIKVNGNDYIIEWYCNYSSLTSDILTTSFDSITLNRPTWPLAPNSKLTLQLMRDNKMVVVI